MNAESTREALDVASVWRRRSTALHGRMASTPAMRLC